MMTDSRKRIWIAPYSGGLRCYSYDGKLLASYSTRNSALSNDIVLSLAEREGQLWIGTDGGGINILTSETGKSSNWNISRDVKTTLSPPTPFSACTTTTITIYGQEAPATD